MSETKRALFVGLNTVDLQFSVTGFPKSNAKVKAKRNNICSGGPATNAAITYSFLGGKADLLTPVGKHSMSKFIIEEISSHGVELIDPAREQETAPIFASIITNELNGERTIFSYHPPISADEQYKMINIQDIDKYAIVLFDGFYPELAVPIATEFKKHHITTVLDGGSWKPGITDLLPLIDIAICSNDLIPPGTTDIISRIDAIHNYGIDLIAITRGKEPIIYSAGKGHSELNISAGNVIDTLGAGDVFHGAFCFFYSINLDFEKALDAASEVATVSCSYFGTREWMAYYQSQK